MDNVSTINSLKQIAQKFVEEREWDQFHTLKNLSMDLSIESAELMEIFLWARDQEDIDKAAESKRIEMEHEVADILLALLCFCNKANIDISQAFKRKIELIAKKYPVERVKGKSAKYTEYID